MKIFVAGMWHLGCVTAACLANNQHEVIAYDANTDVINELVKGKAPIFEPGLDDLLATAQQQHHLTYTTQREEVAKVDMLWITLDTPVDNDDIADTQFVEDEITAFFPHLNAHTLVMISSQLPVGTIHKLQKYCQAHYPQKHITFASIPENLRLGKAIAVFTKPDRFVVGIENAEDKKRITELLAPFTSNIVWMSIASAEMTKHALNAFLATSVVFINELATLCEQVGADAKEVELGLKSEERIGPKAYLRPGNAIAGGTLARDVNYLIAIGKNKNISTPLFSNLLISNHYHKQWTCRRLVDILQNLKDKTIAILGLTYKAGTDTLRRSAAVEMSQWLKAAGAKIHAHDPALTALPQELHAFIDLKQSPQAALAGVDAVVVATEWPEFNAIHADQLIAQVKQPLVFDPSGFLMKNLGNDERIRYFSVGKPE